jgi:hypothetical protein
MRLPVRLLASGLVAALFAACGGTPTLELTVTPATIPGDGTSPVTVSVKLTRSGSPADGTVHVTTTAGSFKDATGDVTQIDLTISDGAATAVILPPRKGRGTIDVKATASLDGTALAKTGSVTLTPSGGLASALDFTCARLNIGAFVTGRTQPIHVQCTATARDASGKAIPNASIETMAEAGRLEWITDDSTGQQNLIYTVDPGATPPKDVDPLDATGKPATCSSACIADPNSSGCIEPCWIDGNITHNPRDGLATLMVAVPGVKAFDDKGEPFVDADDDGVRSATEQYIDYNGNGKYDPPDGTSKERMIWRSVRIVWSGDIDISNTMHGSKLIVSSVAGTSANLTLRLNDRNFNTVAADGEAGTDVIQLAATPDCTQGHTLTLGADELKLNQTKPGIAMTSTGDLDGPQFSTSYRQGSDYTFTASIAPIDQQANTDACGVQAQLARVYDPGAPGFDPSGQLSSESVSGLINFP